MSDVSVMERRSIVAFARAHAGSGTAMVTLVRAEGSSYRQPGARLLIGTGREYAGTVSGGCLEAEVVRRSVWRVRGGAVVDRYSTEFDDTADVPYGLGCGGVLHLLLEPGGTPEFDALLEAMEQSLAGEERVVRTWLPESGRPLRRAVWDDAGELLFQSAELDDVAANAHGGEGVFVERLGAPQRLVIFGAGDDARPVVSVAALLGWSVLVADGRSQLVRAERFPGAERVIVAESAAGVEVRPEDAVVLMTHSYEQDRALLAELVSMPGGLRYLGLLGARHRSSLLVSEAAVISGQTVAACCARLYAPVGLDLGGDGPEAIALAVVAEIQACVQGKLGGVRRLTERSVAEQVKRGGASGTCRRNVPWRPASDGCGIDGCCGAGGRVFAAARRGEANGAGGWDDALGARCGSSAGVGAWAGGGSSGLLCREDR